MCEMLLSPDLDLKSWAVNRQVKNIFYVSKERVAHLRAQHSYSYAMQNLVSLLSHSPEGLS